MHSDRAYDVNVFDCSLRDCSLIATIVLGRDRSECFLLEASILHSLDSPVFRAWLCDVGRLPEKQIVLLSIAVNMAVLLSKWVPTNTTKRSQRVTFLIWDDLHSLLRCMHMVVRCARSNPTCGLTGCLFSRLVCVTSDFPDYAPPAPLAGGRPISL